MSTYISKSYTKKYPKNGDYRSAYVMYDIDSDSENEAVVFYATEDSPYARMAILDKIEGRWRFVSDSAGSGDNVREVFFSKLKNNGKYSIIVGWELSGQEAYQMVVYDFSDKGTVRECSSPYTHYAVNDFDLDGVDDIILMNIAYDTESPKISLIGESNQDNTIIEKAYTNLLGPISDFISMTFFKLHGYPVLYLDEQKGSDVYCTEIIMYLRPNLSNRTYSKDSEYDFSSINIVNDTYRDTPLTSADIDGIEDPSTGELTIEVPRLKSLPGYNSHSSKDDYVLNEWVNFSENHFETFSSTYTDNRFSYSINLPKKWFENKVSMKKSDDGTETIWYEYLDEDQEFGREIFRVKTLPAASVTEILKLKDYKELGVSDTWKYFYYIPKNDSLEAFPLSVSDNDILAMFSINDIS